MTFKTNIENEIRIFNLEFKRALSNKASLLHTVTNYITKNPGKQIRPIIVLISAGLIAPPSEKTYRGAILIELIHTATLIHDDIVDDAHLRRSKLSLNAVWKNKISVLVGDYFLAKGLSLASKYKDFDTLEIISEVVEKMVEGELIQINKTRKLNLTEQDYFKIIELKTASLFEASFKIGAKSINSNKKQLIQLGKLGLIIGKIFQMKDDILDYRITPFSGKKYGKDIEEGKINLPLLYTLNKANSKEKKCILTSLRASVNNKHEIMQIFDLVKKYNGINYTEKCIVKQHDEALQILELFPNNQYKESLVSLLQFIIKS